MFAVLFALALTRISGQRAGARWSTLFDARRATRLLVVIAWVLAVAPIGVFALAFTVGAAAGGAAFAGLGHYVVIISVDRHPGDARRLSAGDRSAASDAAASARGLIAPQAVAISTRSSLASLPAMLDVVARDGHPRGSHAT